MLDAEQRGDERVTARLRQHARAGIDQDDGDIGGRCAGDHIACVLFVSRCVRDDELAMVGGEEAVSDIDGDALFLLGGEAVDQQCEIDIAALRARLLGDLLQRDHLIFEDQLCFVEHAPDQCALAIVDAAAGDEAQQRQVGLRVDVLLDACFYIFVGFTHQK